MKAGWEIYSLGSVCSFENGDRGENYPSKSVQTSIGVPFINAGHLTDDGLDMKSMNYIPMERFDLLGNGKIKPHDILFCLRGSLGKFASVGSLSEGAIASSLVIIRPSQKLINKFLIAYLQSAICEQMIGKFKNGAAQPNLSAASLKNFQIPIPAIQEQQRIVAILDQAFEGIAKARVNAEQNLQNARALFESHLQSVFTQRGEGWVEKHLSHFAQSISTGPFGSLLHKSDYVSKGVPLVNPINIVDGKIKPNNEKQISPATKTRLQSYVLEEGDIVIGRRGEIGRCAVVEREQTSWICGTGCFFIRPLKTTSSHFLANLIRSKKYREELEAASSGATMLNLSNKALSELVVSVPVLQEQKSILGKLDALSKETQRLEALYQRKIACLDELKKSLLQQAFAGEL